MIVKTPGSQMGSPAAAEEGGEEVGGGRWESGESSEVQARSTLTSTAPKARSRSGEVATLDEVPRISLRVSSKLPSSPLSLLSSVICPHKSKIDQEMRFCTLEWLKFLLRAKCPCPLYTEKVLQPNSKV